MNSGTDNIKVARLPLSSIGLDISGKRDFKLVTALRYMGTHRAFKNRSKGDAWPSDERHSELKIKDFMYQWKSEKIRA